MRSMRCEVQLCYRRVELCDGVRLWRARAIHPDTPRSSDCAAGKCGGASTPWYSNVSGNCDEVKSSLTTPTVDPRGAMGKVPPARRRLQPRRRRRRKRRPALASFARRSIPPQQAVGDADEPLTGRAPRRIALHLPLAACATSEVVSELSCGSRHRGWREREREGGCVW
jgi:hypothetical protein